MASHECRHAEAGCGLGLRYLSIVVAFLLGIFSQSTAFCSAITNINTPEGLLKTGPGRGPDCFRCAGLFLGNKQLFHDFGIYINAVYPLIGAAKLVSISVDGGGSCCPPTPYILDFTTLPHKTISGYGFGKDVSQSEKGIVFSQETSENEYGDPMLDIFEYELGSGKMAKLSSAPQYTSGSLSEKKSGWYVLGDPMLRGPLVTLMGVRRFHDLRRRVTLGSEGDSVITDDAVIVSEGCMPHNCDSSGGIFILDTKNHVAWAAEREDGRGTVWGQFDKRDLFASKIVATWLLNNRIDADKITHVPLSIGAIVGYASRKNVDDVRVDLNKEVKFDVGNAKMGKELNPVEFFKLLSPSIYVVIAKNSSGETLQGSAVAVSDHILLTNCHVVANADEVILSHNDVKQRAFVTFSDPYKDKCVLSSNGVLVSHASVRAYNDLVVGEKVYTIGAPAGLELTLSDGLLSGKRTDNNRHLIQTSAPISPGSSGGGLFDASGNLIGITTFRLKDSENLNFAIAAEDYLTH